MVCSSLNALKPPNLCRGCVRHLGCPSQPGTLWYFCTWIKTSSGKCCPTPQLGQGHPLGTPPLDSLCFLLEAWTHCLKQKHVTWDVPGDPVVGNPPSSAGYVGSIPGWGTKDATRHWATKPVRRNQRSLSAATTEPLSFRAQTPQPES